VLRRHCRDQKQGRHILVSTLDISHHRCYLPAAWAMIDEVRAHTSWWCQASLRRRFVLALVSDAIRAGCSSAFVVLAAMPSIMQCVILLQPLCFAPDDSLISLLTEVPSSVSFSQLQKQIIDLATTHFVHLPVRPPAEDLAQVPSNLPSFLGDTAASR
jgi:hypothetical protein